MTTTPNKVGRLHIRRMEGEAIIIGEGPSAVIIKIEKIRPGQVDITAIGAVSTQIDRLERRELTCKSAS